MNSILLGSTGNLSTELQRSLNPNKTIIIPSKEIFFDTNFENNFRKIFSNLNVNHRQLRIFNTIGVTNPNLSLEIHNSVNLQFPKFLCNWSCESKHKIITFGSILETSHDFTGSNSYYRAKNSFYRCFASEFSDSKNLHLQIHTWYGGGKKHPHMFLSQIISSLANNTIFEMSSGEQLREYHHISDDVQMLLSRINFLSGIHQISHGKPVSLRKMALEIFRYFGKEELLRFGLPPIDNENYSRVYEPESWVDVGSFRETIDGIIDYVKLELKGI